MALYVFLKWEKRRKSAYIYPISIRCGVLSSRISENFRCFDGIFIHFSCMCHLSCSNFSNYRTNNRKTLFRQQFFILATQKSMGKKTSTRCEKLKEIRAKSFNDWQSLREASTFVCHEKLTEEKSCTTLEMKCFWAWLALIFWVWWVLFIAVRFNQRKNTLPLLEIQTVFSPSSDFSSNWSRSALLWTAIGFQRLFYWAFSFIHVRRNFSDFVFI